MKAVHKIRSHEALTSCDIRKRLKKRHSDPHRLIYDEYGELPIAFFQKYKNSICCIFASIPYFLYSVFIRHFALCMRKRTNLERMSCIDGHIPKLHNAVQPPN